MLWTMEKKNVKTTISEIANLCGEKTAKRKYENEVVAMEGEKARSRSPILTICSGMRVTVGDHRRQYFAALSLIGTVAYLRVAMSSVKRAL